MKIAINARFLTQAVTGVQRYAREVCSELANIPKGYCHFILIAPRGKLINPPSGMEIFQDGFHLSGHPWEQFRLPHLVRKLKADLLWSPCNVGPIFVPNQVVTMHDASVFADPDWFSRWFHILYRFLLPALGRKVKKVLTVSNFSKAEIVKYGIAPQEKIDVILLGCNSKFNPSNFTRPNNFVGSPYILTIGSRNPRKNIKRLIAAWGSLSPEVKGKRKLVVVGEGARVFSSERLGDIPRDVVFISMVEEEELAPLYSQAEAFIFPTLYEGFGLPPLEAMACGCPVVVSHVASLPEVCGDAAYYVDPYSVESIADGIYKVLTDNNLRQALIRRGLEQVKLFSWEKSAREHLKLFEEVLNS